MNNQNNNQSNSYSFRITDILWTMLEQWKAVLLFAVIVAMVVTLALSWRDATTSKDNKTNKVVVEQVKESLTDVDKREVNYMLELRKKFLDETDYYNGSILMSMDPYDSKSVVSEWYIDGDDNVAAYVMSYYAALLAKDESINMIKDTINQTARNSFINELVTVNGSSLDTYGSETNAGNLTDHILRIRVFIPESTDSDKLLSVLSDIVNNNKPKIPYDYSMTCKNESTGNNVSQYILDRQTLRVEKTTYFRNSYKTAYENLSGIQRNAYEIIAKDEGLLDNNTANKKTSGFKMRYPFVGFVLGLLIYLVLLMIFDISSKKINNPLYIFDKYGYGIIGIVNEKKNYSGIQLLLHDMNIVKRHREKSTFYCYSKETLSTRVKSLLNRGDISRITILDLRSGDNSCTILNNIKVDLINRGEEPDVICLGNKQEEIEKVISNINNPVIILCDNELNKRILSRITNALELFNVPVVGYIYS